MVLGPLVITTFRPSGRVVETHSYSTLHPQMESTCGCQWSGLRWPRGGLVSAVRGSFIVLVTLSPNFFSPSKESTSPRRWIRRHFGVQISRLLPSQTALLV